MAKIVSIHELEVPEEQKAEVEQFFHAEVADFKGLEGWKYTLLKSHRGSRIGKYAIMIEIESTAAHDRYFPQQDVQSPEMQRVLEAYPDFFARWNTLVVSAQRDWSSYIILSAPETGSA
jgi:heme-degrading monooxygenase HmoA